MSVKCWHPDKTIFVQIGHYGLKAQIETWAASRGFEVFTGSSYDLIACGYLFAIVEREEVGNKVWNDHLDYLRDSEDPTPCVVINARHRESEKNISNLHYVFDPHSADWPQLLDSLLRQNFAGCDLELRTIAETVRENNHVQKKPKT